MMLVWQYLFYLWGGLAGLLVVALGVCWLIGSRRDQ